MTAEKMIVAHKIKTCVEEFVRRFSAIRRTAQASELLQKAYEPVLGETLAKRHSENIHQVVAQCSLFLCGTIYRDLVEIQQRDPGDVPAILQQQGSEIIQEHLLHIIDFAKQNKDKADRSWPVLLKNNAFFMYVTAYLAGVRKNQK